MLLDVGKFSPSKALDHDEFLEQPRVDAQLLTFLIKIIPENVARYKLIFFSSRVHEIVTLIILNYRRAR